jgi:hypothetical protein
MLYRTGIFTVAAEMTRSADRERRSMAVKLPVFAIALREIASRLYADSRQARAI